MIYRLLLVEDEKWVRTAIRKVIEKVELPVTVVHEASNGMDASDWLKLNDAELVLTDIRMPVMDGLSLLKEIKENQYSAGVVMISGHDDFAYVQKALRHGAFDYLLKPVEKEELDRCLREWIRTKEHASSGKNASSHVVNIQELSPVDQVIHFIESNRAYDISSAEAADRIHLNPSYFSKLFKQTKGMTFTDYVTAIRMKEAARLLENTSLRVTEIAERLGFTDSAYFTNTFKKATGQTPSNYRKALLEKK
ncbi:response regulator transcription factor [Paenibacillus alkalitolerans]|uniref:response regulator transcription factor n=1 Tax=Paenibacillus alkalitolerans TaxID=2799335 RepID=UPI0018F608E4|nr:response regulator [Paenibacillus alkalitolerans]